LLGIELGPQIHEVEESPQAEAHDEVLAVIKGEDAASVLFGEASLKQIAVPVRSLLAEL
jgi:hypothetical protein